MIMSLNNVAQQYEAPVPYLNHIPRTIHPPPPHALTAPLWPPPVPARCWAWACSTPPPPPLALCPPSPPRGPCMYGWRCRNEYKIVSRINTSLQAPSNAHAQSTQPKPHPLTHARTGGSPSPSSANASALPPPSAPPGPDPGPGSGSGCGCDPRAAVCVGGCSSCVSMYVIFLS